jgi:hypothetical protein
MQSECLGRCGRPRYASLCKEGRLFARNFRALTSVSDSRHVFACLRQHSIFDLLVANPWITIGRSMLAQTNEDRPLMPRKGAVVARLLAAALIAAVGFAQLSSSWHEANVRHVQCAEHGEPIDVEMASDLGPSTTRDRASGAGMEGADSTEAASHHHCSVMFAFRASARTQLLRLATLLIPPAVVVRRVSEPAPRPGRACVLASAPKTSPPAA